MKLATILTTVTVTLFSPLLNAAPALKLSGLFRDNMVIQRETDAPIWGWGEPGKRVTVKASWDRKKHTVKVDTNGKWTTTLSTPKAGGPFKIEVASGKEEITLKNILSGEVWICSGQSNMQWKMRGFGLEQFREDVEKAKFPEIRYCLIPQVRALEPQSDVTTSWSVCSPQTVLGYSAVAYFFGARLHQELDVPIGLISTNWGGSSAEAWVSEEVLKKDFPEFNDTLKDHAAIKEDHGALFPNRAKAPKGLSQTSPTVLFNSMIEPLIPFAMRGVVWYQGESNVKEPEQYRTLFPALIRDWRSRWDAGDFPFYYVQIAPFVYNNVPIPAALLREAQLMTLAESNTGMVVTMDVGAADNIHPKEKKPVGERLALLALAHDYGKDIVFSGPLFQSLKKESKKLRLSFTHVGGGLATKDGEALTHFTIAGSNKTFHPAEAVIDGDTIVVSSSEVSRPVAVRFGWGNADLTNFINKEGLPASSFRTDDWDIKER